MTSLIISAATKGGVGKSTVLRFLTTWLQDSGVEPYLIDADDENATMTRFFAQAHRLEPRRQKSYDLFVNLAETGAHPIIIADLKAGASYDVLKFFADVPFDELKALRVRVVCIGVITRSPDSVSSFLRWPHALGKSVEYIVCKSLKDSDAAGLDAATVSFPEYDQTKQALEFRKKYKPAEIIMPGLDPEYQCELEKYNLTIRDVLARRAGLPDSLTPLMVRSKLRNYQTAIYAQFNAIKELLLP